eukprot:scpid13324/ scgid35359/ 
MPEKHSPSSMFSRLTGQFCFYWRRAELHNPVKSTGQLSQVEHSLGYTSRRFSPARGGWVLVELLNSEQERRCRWTSAGTHTRRSPARMITSSRDRGVWQQSSWQRSVMEYGGHLVCVWTTQVTLG